jgi:GT2 family glycosyltransferase
MISVIIVNYNSAYLTKRAVASVFAQDEDVEVIVVDNSATLAEQQYLSDISRAYDVRLIFNESNVGFGKACNQAFSCSRGEFIFLLNPDAYLIPPCLRILREFMESEPRAGSVSPLLYWDNAMTYLFPNSFAPSPAQDFCAALSRTSSYFGRLYSHYGRRRNLGLWKASAPLKVKNLSGGTIMLGRSTIERIGGLFDEQFFMFYEDSDLFLRLGRAGYRLYFVPCAKAVHSYRHAVLKLDIMDQSRKLYYRKHYANSLFLRLAERLQGYSEKGRYTKSGSWSTAPFFSIPPQLRKGYLFEWSPSPFFIPSVGFFGEGETFIFSEEIWHSIEEGDYYVRFSNNRKWFFDGETLFWRKR